MQLRRRNSQGKRDDPYLDLEGVVPLTCLKEGVKVVMAHSSGNGNVVRRLSEMGLTPGCELQILRKCSFHGPIEVEVRGVALALGYDLASQILVQDLKANANAN